MIKLIHADNFFKPEEVKSLWNISYDLNWTQKEYGQEIENFNLVFPGLDPIFSSYLGQEVTVMEEQSGIFRRPMQCIHFESFDSVDEWCFVVALERTTFNVYDHLENGPASKIDSHNALEGYHFNYRNMLEWDINTNIILQPNQGVFFRPWLFHSLEDGIVQYYRLQPK